MFGNIIASQVRRVRVTFSRKSRLLLIRLRIFQQQLLTRERAPLAKTGAAKTGASKIENQKIETKTRTIESVSKYLITVYGRSKVI